MTLVVVYHSNGLQNVLRNISGKITTFIRPLKTNSPTPNSRATQIPPIRKSFTYIETSGNVYGPNVFVGFERTGSVQFS